VTLVLVDTSTWSRRAQRSVGMRLAGAIENQAVVTVEPVVLELLRAARDASELTELAEEYDSLGRIELSPAVSRRARYVQAALAKRGYHRGPSPTDLIAAAAAEGVGAEVWHCDRHFDLIAEVTSQPVRRVGR
jgi:predicted nucleic acid-binding protein